MLKKKIFPVLILASSFLATKAYSAPLAVQAYAAQCDKEIGVTVPGFDCDAGTLVPTTRNGNPLTLDDTVSPNKIVETKPDGTKVTTVLALGSNNLPGSFTLPIGFKCDRPNALNSVCDPGSRFQVLVNNPEALVVAHCRRQGREPHGYSDVAVIQHNKITGASCFYQNQLQRTGGNLVFAPTKQTTSDSQRFNEATSGVGSGCMTCHDNGPLIRSPYLTQIKLGKDVIPGAGQSGANKGQPYFMVGAENFKTYAVTVNDRNKDTGVISQSPTTQNGCVNCHSLSLHAFTTSATSIIANAVGFGITATQQVESSSKTGISIYSPMWMSFAGTGSTAYSAAAFSAASEIQTCATQFSRQVTTIPNSFSAMLTDVTVTPNVQFQTRGCTVNVKTGRAAAKAMSIVNYAATCLERRSDGIAFVASCIPNKALQKWTFDPSTSQISVMNGTSKLCLATVGTTPDLTGAVAVTTAACTTAPNVTNVQKWTYDGYMGQFHNVGVDNAITDPIAFKKCLDTNGGFGGSVAIMYDCRQNGAEFQGWAIQDLSYQIIQNFSDQTRTLNNATSATTLTVATSVANTTQSTHWSIERVQVSKESDPKYRIRNRTTNKFMVFRNGAMTMADVNQFDVAEWEWTAQWSIRQRPGYPANGQINGVTTNVYTIQNVNDPTKYIVFKNGTLQTTAVNDALASDVTTALWILNSAP